MAYNNEYVAEYKDGHLTQELCVEMQVTDAMEEINKFCAENNGVEVSLKFYGEFIAKDYDNERGEDYGYYDQEDLIGCYVDYGDGEGLEDV